MFVKDEEDDQNDSHDQRHEPESVPRPVSWVQIRDTNRTENTGQTSARTQNTHPSALMEMDEIRE